MTETSRFWDSVTVGDAVASPYDAETEFAQVLRDLRITTAGINRGAVLTSIGSGLTAAGTVGSVTVQDGYAFVSGNWYHSDAPVAFAIPTPGSSTRIDRIVLRKNWAAQTVRLTRISGVEGAGEPPLVQAEGTTWDIPICRASITTGGVITTTDERDVAAPAGAAVCVPFVTNAALPHTNYTGTPGILTPIAIALTGVPAKAVGALVSFRLTADGSGSFAPGELGATGSSASPVYKASPGPGATIYPPIFIPIDNALGEIGLMVAGGGAINIDFWVSAYFVPLY